MVRFIWPWEKDKVTEGIFQIDFKIGVYFPYDRSYGDFIWNPIGYWSCYGDFKVWGQFNHYPGHGAKFKQKDNPWKRVETKHCAYLVNVNCLAFCQDDPELPRTTGWKPHLLHYPYPYPYPYPRPSFSNLVDPSAVLNRVHSTWSPICQECGGKSEKLHMELSRM